MACRYPEETTQVPIRTDSTQNPDYLQQIDKAREEIKACFKKSHELLYTREEIFLGKVDQIERAYHAKMTEMHALVDQLEANKTACLNNLKLVKLEQIRKDIIAKIDDEIAEIAVITDISVEFEWDYLFEKDIGELGSIKVNGQTEISSIHTFSPHVKLTVPNYSVKKMPTVFCCKKFTDQQAPGELNGPRCIAVHYKTGNIYIADQNHNRVQVFSSNGDFLFIFQEKMDKPLGISISQDKVFVTQFGANCLNKYEIKGRLLKSVGSEGLDSALFRRPYGVCASDRTSYVYVCDFANDRVQIFTEDLDYLSMFGIGLFSHPCDIKVTRDRIVVLDESDPCIFMFHLDHSPITRLITRGVGKQTTGVISFEIDRESNLILSGYNEHCVYIFTPAGKLIHKFGKFGRQIGEFNCPWGVALDNQGRIIVVCHKSKECLQFF